MSGQWMVDGRPSGHLGAALMIAGVFQFYLLGTVPEAWRFVAGAFGLLLWVNGLAISAWALFARGIWWATALGVVLIVAIFLSTLVAVRPFLP